MKLNHAILHIIDFVSCANVFSQCELDITDKNIKRYITSQLRRAQGNVESMHGEFASDSNFADALKAYFRGGDSFVALSADIAQFFATELTHMEKPPSTDVLVVDFEEDLPNTPDTMSDEEVEASFKGQGKRYFAFFLLESRQAFTHSVGRSADGDTCTNLERHYAILPSPSQKVHSFALIEADTLAVSFVDKPREISGEEKLLIPDGILQCSKEASSKEVFSTVAEVAEEVAAEFGANPALAVSRAKTSVAMSAEAQRDVVPEDIATDVFEDEEQQERFREAVAERPLPTRVKVKQSEAERITKNHKIRTDTGIEITFPARYCRSPEFIEFVNEPNGLISIELKNIGHIENR